MVLGISNGIQLANLFNILLKLHLINIYNIAKFNFSFLLEKLYHLNNNNHSIFFFKFLHPSSMISSFSLYTMQWAAVSYCVRLPHNIMADIQQTGIASECNCLHLGQGVMYEIIDYVTNQRENYYAISLTVGLSSFLMPFKKFRFFYCLLLPRKSRNKKQTILFSFSKIKLKTLLTYSSFIFFVSH